MEKWNIKHHSENHDRICFDITLTFVKLFIYKIFKTLIKTKTIMLVKLHTEKIKLLLNEPSYKNSNK